MTKIFISYAYVDNQNFVNNNRGWISIFKDDLEQELSFLLGKIVPITIFHNKQFNSPNLLTIKHLKSTKILIVIGTPAYYFSDFCQKELNYFLKRKDIIPHKSTFLVDKKPFEDIDLQMSLPSENFFPFYNLENGREWSSINNSETYMNQIKSLASQIKMVLDE